jgi:hypothetical protein
MKNISLFSVLFLSTVGFTLHVSAFAAEHSVPCSNLPQAVQDKIKEVSAGAVIHGCVKDISKGVTTWEAEMMAGTRSKDVTFGSNGDVLEVEEQVDVDSLPIPVKEALLKAAKGGTVDKAESLSRRGTIVSYEAVIKRKGVHHEIAFHPDGSAMKAD